MFDRWREALKGGQREEWLEGGRVIICSLIDNLVVFFFWLLNTHFHGHRHLQLLGEYKSYWIVNLHEMAGPLNKTVSSRVEGGR